MWTKASIAQLLRTHDHAVERAIVAIYEHQTLDEKVARHTKRINPRGFHANHTITGSYYAILVLAGRRLVGYHLANARNIVLCYTTQLADRANARAARLAKREVA